MGDNKRTFKACPKCKDGYDWLVQHEDGSWEFNTDANNCTEITHCTWCGHKLSELVQKEENPTNVADVVSEIIASLENQRSGYEVGTEIRHAYNEAIDRLRVLESKLLNSDKNRVLMDIKPFYPENIEPGKISAQLDPQLPKWEYKVLSERSQCERDVWLDVLRGLGDAGWELIVASLGMEITRWVFKRRKP